MKAQQLAASRLAAEIPAQRLLEGLSRPFPLIVVMDVERGVLWRSEALAALDPERFEVGASLRRELPERTRPEQVFPLRAGLHSGETPGRFRVVIHRDGEAPQSVEFELAQIESGTGEPLLVGLARGAEEALVEDCASREELVRANEELEHCVNALAHDLRSPLVALLGFSRLLRQDYGALLDKTGRHFLDRIEQAGRTMESLIHDLLELSRIEGPGECTPWVDPLRVLVQLKAEQKPRLEEAGIELALPELPPPLVACDRTRLYQVFSNLIGNAIEHMGERESPRIRVEVHEHPYSHELIVRDNGRGIAPEHHERIFEVFRSLATRRRGRKGAGMGLAIVRRIAEAYRGRVWVESELGAGTSFHVSLPRPDIR